MFRRIRQRSVWSALRSFARWTPLTETSLESGRLRPDDHEGHQPPHGIPRSNATCRAARSTPVWPPEIKLSIKMFTWLKSQTTIHPAMVFSSRSVVASANVQIPEKIRRLAYSHWKPLVQRPQSDARHQLLQPRRSLNRAQAAPPVTRTSHKCSPDTQSANNRDLVLSVEKSTSTSSIAPARPVPCSNQS